MVACVGLLAEVDVERQGAVGIDGEVVREAGEQPAEVTIDDLFTGVGHGALLAWGERMVRLHHNEL